MTPSPTNWTHRDRQELTAFLGALSLFLATIEYMIPKPVPYIRLGISNIPILLALPLLPGRYIFLLALAKTLGQALLNGTLLSYVFLLSFGGTFSSTIVMIGLYYIGKKHFSFLGISLLGALTSSLVQILISLQWLFGSQAVVLIPFILFTGLTGGMVVGFFSLYFSEKSSWYRQLRKRL